MKNYYQKSKGKAPDKTIKRKAERNPTPRVAWSGSKGTYIRAKHGELK